MNDTRYFAEHDRAAVVAMGAAVIDDWDRFVALHLVVGDPAVAHLQAVDRDTTPSRRPGCIEMRLVVAPEQRRRGIGGRLFERVLAFADERQAESIRAAYLEHSPDEPAAIFLRQRGFVELQRYQPSRLDVSACDLSPFHGLEQQLVTDGVCFFTYAVTTQVRTGGDGAGPHEIYLLDSTVGCPSHDDA
jgi:GNAT superfamily N-acetyltransferase